MIEREKKTRSKVAMEARNRVLLLIAGIGLLAACAGGLIYARLPRQEQVETALYSYGVTADASYRVHVPPTQLYEGEWLEEGRLYSSTMADLVELVCRVDAQGDGPARISGSYRVDALLEGYQLSGEVKRTVYQKQYSLAQGELTALSDRQAEGAATVRLGLADYHQFGNTADGLLGVSVSRDLSVTFSGSVRISSEYGERQEDFSYVVALPLPKSASLFEIKKPGPAERMGQITRSEDVDLPAKGHLFPVFGAMGAAGTGVILFASLLTRRPTAQERARTRCEQIKRKYGSRMVGLSTMPDYSGRALIQVRDMEGLLAMAEEMRLPACYWSDAHGLPRDGLCFVAAPECVYEYRPPSQEERDTTLVPETGAEGGSISGEEE